MPDVPILGVGGVRSGWDALELMAAGASAVQVGTTIFSDPGAPVRILRELAIELGARGFAKASDACRLRASALVMVPFGARLRAAMAERGQLCVGIDPHPALLHAWGLGDDPAGLESFALLTVEAMAGEVAAVKPQSAFFERHGSAASRCSSG
jgi:hypothetical protein